MASVITTTNLPLGASTQTYSLAGDGHSVPPAMVTSGYARVMPTFAVKDTSHPIDPKLDEFRLPETKRRIQDKCLK